MHDLGVLCGLLPDLQPSSQQLNLVVDLISGMSQNEGKFLAFFRVRAEMALGEKALFWLSELSGHFTVFPNISINL